MKYHINPGAGSNTNSGTEEWPFETVDHALTLFVPGDRIALSRGYKYPPISIANLDGTDLNRYTWEAYGVGADPVVSAFIEPSGGWVDQGANIWTYTDATLQEVNVLTISGVDIGYGRWPKRATAEYYDIDSATDNTQIVDNTNLSGQPSYIGGELVSKKLKWRISRDIITAQTSNSITVTGSPVNFVPGNGYFVQNHENLCTEQNDWAYDSTAKKVTIYSTTDPNLLDIKLSFAENAIYIDRSDYHDFNDIVFEGAYDANIFLNYSNHVTFSNCYSRFAGENGIQTFESKNLKWDLGVITDCHNMGINNRDLSQDLTVTYSSFLRIAIIPGMGVSGNGQQNAIHVNNTEDNCIITNNYIYEVGNCGISFMGDNPLVADNYIDKCAQTVSDAACIYSFGDFSTPYIGGIIERNICLNTLGNEDGIGSPVKQDSCGIYTDDNDKNRIVRNNYIENCGYGGYMHNNQNVSYLDNTFYNCGIAFRIKDDYVQGVGTTNRVRNNTVTGNKFVALAGQLVYEFITETEPGDVDPFLYGTINNNELSSVEAFPFTSSIDFVTNVNYTLSTLRSDLGFDVNSTVITYDPSKTITKLNATEEVETQPLSAIYEDSEGNLYNSGGIQLQPNQSIILFYVTELPPPITSPSAYMRGVRFVNMEDYYGSAIYDTYTRGKANNAEFGASLMDVKPIADKVLAHSWDMVNVPVAYKDNALYSMIGPDLVVSGGGNGSRWDKNGLLVTGLPNDRPRFTFDPAVVGKFEGLLLESEDENKLLWSEDFTDAYYAKSGINVVLQSILNPQGLLSASEVTEDSGTTQHRFIRSMSFVDQQKYTTSVFIKRSNGTRQFQLGVTTTGNIARAYFNLDSVAVDNLSGTETVATIKQISNNWFLCSITSLATATSGNIFIAITNNTALSSETYAGDGVSGLYKWGVQFNNKNTSYIKTTSSPVTRPADTLQATGLINTASPYSIFEIRNGQGILKYIDPVAGTVRTYTDGQYIGEEAVTPSVDLLVNSQGSDKLLGVAYKSGVLTEQERLARSDLML